MPSRLLDQPRGARRAAASVRKQEQIHRWGASGETGKQRERRLSSESERRKDYAKQVLAEAIAKQAAALAAAEAEKRDSAPSSHGPRQAAPHVRAEHDGADARDGSLDSTRREHEMRLELERINRELNETRCRAAAEAGPQRAA